MEVFTLNELTYSSNHEGGCLRLYIYENGSHRGGIFFRKIPRYDEEISAESSRRLIDKAILDGKEIRVTNASDHLVLHFKEGALIHPATLAEFWGQVFA